MLTGLDVLRDYILVDQTSGKDYPLNFLLRLKVVCLYIANRMDFRNKAGHDVTSFDSPK
jgi:hypothetical protein